MAGTVNLNGYDVHEIQGSGTFDLSVENFTAVRKFRVPFDNVMDLAISLFDTTAQIGPIFFPNSPAFHPKYPGILWITNVTVGPYTEETPSYNDSDGVIYYEDSLLTVTYGTDRFSESEGEDPDEEENGIRFTEKVTFAGEFLNIPKGSLIDAETRVQIDTPTSIWIPSSNIQLSFPAVKAKINKEWIFENNGKVNEKEFRGVPAGHLLFGPPNTERSVSFDGGVKKSLDLLFLQRGKKWNQVIDKAGDWVDVEPEIYEELDFDLIWKKIYK